MFPHGHTRYHKNSCETKIFAELSDELSGVICLLTLVLLDNGMPSKCSESSLVLFVGSFWLCESFSASDFRASLLSGICLGTTGPAQRRGSLSFLVNTFALQVPPLTYVSLSLSLSLLLHGRCCRAIAA